MEVDWAKLAEEFEAPDSGGTDLAKRALDRIIGEEMLHGAIEHYIDWTSGSELARSVLIHLRSPEAMSRCYRIYKDDPEIERRRGAVELLRMISDYRALPWVGEFLDDPDPYIQGYGGSMLDQLLFANMVGEDACAGLLAIMRDHANEGVRHYHSLIMNFLGSRAS